jgi:hypothetical protein
VIFIFFYLLDAILHGWMQGWGQIVAELNKVGAKFGQYFAELRQI